MKAKHTPGPWTVNESTNDYMVVAGRERIAGYISKANAQLIAAAPDLLALAREIHEYFGNGRIEQILSTDRRLRDTARSLVRRVEAK